MVRRFDTGATRDTDADKLDFDGFLCPLVLDRYARYMHEHRRLPDGTLRPADNWKQGIPLVAYRKSAWRHFQDFWKAALGFPCEADIEDSICAEIFNLSGYLHEILKVKAGAERSAPKYGELIPHEIAMAALRDMAMADDDAPDQNPVSPIGAQSGTPVNQEDEE